MMFNNYLKMFLRSLRKHKLFSLVNVAGLAIGMASSILILQYVINEYSYDSFWSNADNIYRVTHQQYQNGVEQFHSAKTFEGVGEAMFNEFPEVKSYTKFMQDEVMCYTGENETRLNNQNFFWVDTTFLDVFKLDFVYGSGKGAFNDNYSSLISESASKKLFGNIDPVGKWYKVNEGWAFCVTGVFRDIPENSHLNMHFMASDASLWFYIMNWDNTQGKLVSEENRNAVLPTHYSDSRQWRWAGSYTYVYVDGNADPKQTENKLVSLVDSYTEQIKQDGGDVHLSLQKIKDIHLSSNLQQELSVNGDKDLVLALLFTAFIILVIAFVNYINLSLVKSMKRAKETALRKTIGAEKKQIIIQHLLESFFINLIAIVVALILIELINILFVRLAGKPIIPGNYTDNYFMLIVFSFLFWGTLLSGGYPAFVLSSFRPVDLFKKGLSFKIGSVSLRKILIAFQFTVAVVLLTVTFVVYKQITFMQNQDLGVNIDQVLYMRSPYTMIKKPQRLERLNAFKSELKKIIGVKNFTTSSSIPGCENLWQRDDVRKAGTAPDQKNNFSIIVMDNEFIPTLGLKLISGRNFLLNEMNQSSIIINEEAAKLLGYNKNGSAVNESIQVGDELYSVIGVIEDYHHEYLKKAIQPTIYFNGYDWRLDVGYYSAKINSDKITSTIDDIKGTWEALYPEEPFDYYFMDQTYKKQYEADQQFGIIFSSFSLISLFLTAFGLFGLTSYNAIMRTKEIGIRKTLGAKVSNVFYLLNKEFVILLAISYGVSVPIAFFIAKAWLVNYSYKIMLDTELFVLPFLIILLIIFAAISIQALKAARANPVNSLKYE